MKAITEVLLVDDNPGDTDLTADVLGRNACPSHVHSVPDGAEAMAFLRCQGRYADAILPHLIILDLNMPLKDGLTMLAEVKSDPELREIPIVIFSASLARRDIARSYDLGANSYVGKPGDLHGFVAAVTAIGDFWFGVSSVAGRDCR
jgi:two-component system, chemotaxis family, response regulator Rcp1